MKLAQWLIREDRTAAWFSRQVKRSPATVVRWISGERNPCYQSVRLIEKATGGKVTRNDFIRRSS